MTKIENDLIKHQIELERVENGIVRDCIKQLNASCRKVSEELARTNGVTTKKRYQQIRSYLKETAKELESNVESTMDLEEFIDYELQTEKKMFDGLNLTYPTKEQLITSVQFAPYCKSAVFENYLDSIGEQFFSVWDGEVRSGYLTGMTAQQITRRVVGSVAQSGAVTDAGALHTLRNSILMNTRTALQGFANNTRMAIFEKNADAFKGYKWLSTLDRRTCLVCGEKEGKISKVIDEVPPLHLNCRCVIVPVVRGDMPEFTDERASEFGVVEGNITYEEWLGEQSSSVQKEILGKTRYEIYKETGKIGQFVDNGKILTIAELKENL